MPASIPTVPERSMGGSGRRPWLHLATTIVLSALLAVVALDGLGAVDAFGVDQQTEVAAGAGYVLEVSAPTASRPGLATPLEIRVRKEGGFAAPVEVGISTRYLLMFDYQNQYPEPKSVRTMGGLTIFELEPPIGDEAAVMSFDWRLEPAQQSGGSATIAVIDDDRPVLALDTHLRVWP